MAPLLIGRPLKFFQCSSTLATRQHSVERMYTSTEVRLLLLATVWTALRTHIHSPGGSTDRNIPYLVMLKNPGK